MIRLESRPSNIEGRGEVTIRDLVKNSLRMRPDRIVVGEVRDAAALDMLQAMNTGHDGSICTVHANTPRDTLARIETMVLMAGVDLPVRAIREQVSSAIDLVVQQARFKDGSRHITHITEVVGMEGDIITMQDIYQLRLRRRVRRRGPCPRHTGHHGPAAQVPRQAGAEWRARRHLRVRIRRDLTMTGRTMRWVAAVAATATLGLGSGVAWAAPEGRIQEVESVDGAVTYVLSAEGLAEGESIDPTSVRTTLAARRADHGDPGGR